MYEPGRLVKSSGMSLVIVLKCRRKICDEAAFSFCNIGFGSHSILFWWCIKLLMNEVKADATIVTFAKVQ